MKYLILLSLFIVNVNVMQTFSMDKDLISELKSAIEAGDENNLHKLLREIDLKKQSQNVQHNLYISAVRKNNLNILKLLIEAKVKIDYSCLKGTKNRSFIEYLILSPITHLDNIIFYMPNLPEMLDLKKMAEVCSKSLKERVMELAKMPRSEFKQQHLDEFSQIIRRVGIIQDQAGYNPLHRAIESQNYLLAQWLFELPMNYKRSKNKIGDTPIDLGFGLYASSEEFLGFVENLIKKNLITLEEVLEAKRKIENFGQERLISMEKLLDREKKEKK